MHVLAFAVPDGDFFAGEQERQAITVFVCFRERRNFFAQFLESRNRRVGFFGEVFLRECKIVSVIGTAHKVKPDCFCRLLQNFWRGAVFHMVGGVMRMAMHFACGVAWSDWWKFF